MWNPCWRTGARAGGRALSESCPTKSDEGIAGHRHTGGKRRAEDGDEDESRLTLARLDNSDNSVPAVLPDAPAILAITSTHTIRCNAPLVWARWARYTAWPHSCRDPGFATVSFRTHKYSTMKSTTTQPTPRSPLPPWPPQAGSSVSSVAPAPPLPSPWPI
jgi:hypothetical protein